FFFGERSTMTTIMLKNTRSCDVTLDGVTIQAGRTQALEAAYVEQLRQHPGIGLWFDNGYLVEQEVEPSCAPVGGGEGHTDPTTEKPPVTEEARHDAALGKAGKSRRT
ncbi:hypothetical protein, partial [Xylella fastidiosa]|uniref:hypothetical protein n=2 Tax=Xylella fastidiosa TaxID=2371 RepID=UPI0023616D49